MNKVAIAYSTKDRIELSKRTIEPLLQPDKVDLFWIDGSIDPEAIQLVLDRGPSDFYTRFNIRGGADAAIVHNLTLLLQHPNNYEFLGLVENDVLLHPDWFAPTMALFERGKAEGLNVGAVSARCYEDRILFQRDDYAVCHNLGAGCIIFTREAAQIALYNFRTGWWSENRRIFAQVSGIDIGRYAAFRANEQWVCGDWHIETVLAEFGLVALALTPSPVEMIGQNPPLAEQGLKLVTESVELLRNDKQFAVFVERMAQRRDHKVQNSNQTEWHQADSGTWMIFPHQIAALGGHYGGDWRLKWSQGFGPFAWKAGWDGKTNIGQQFSKNISTLTVPVSGACAFLVSGGEKGGQVSIRDTASGYECSPTLPPEGDATQILNLPVPGGVTYREIVLTMLTPGTIFYGLQCREPQPFRSGAAFDYATLPPA